MRAALYCRLLPLLLLANMATTSSESEGWYDCKYEFCVKAKFAFFAVCKCLHANTSSSKTQTGTNKAASSSNVQKAWRRLARATHPDTARRRGGGSSSSSSSSNTGDEDLFNDADKLKTAMKDPLQFHLYRTFLVRYLRGHTCESLCLQSAPSTLFICVLYIYIYSYRRRYMIVCARSHVVRWCYRYCQRC